MAPFDHLLDGLPSYVRDPPIEAVVLAFGVNEDFQLGLDGNEDVLSPKVVEALLGTRLRGREFARSPIVAGSRNTFALTADGEVLAWGWNARATLGMGYRGPPEPKPRRIPGLKGIEIVQVALGGWHVLALDVNGQVWAWGGNEYQQSQGDPELRDVIVPTPCLPELRVRQVSAGGMSSLALTEDGHLWQWGEPWGDFSMVIDRRPRRIDTSGGFVRIACGAFHSLAVTYSGELYTWGINDFGQLGNGTTSYATEPKRIAEGLENVVVADVAAGGWHSIALSTEGAVYAFGRGEWGRLGVGDSKGSSKLKPTRIESLSDMRIVEAAAGGTHSIFVTDDGRAYITGRGSFGRLGTGTEQNFFSPVEVRLPGGPDRWRVISAAAGGRSSFLLALPDNGDLEPDGSRTSSVTRTASVSSLDSRAMQERSQKQASHDVVATVSSSDRRVTSVQMNDSGVGRRRQRSKSLQEDILHVGIDPNKTPSRSHYDDARSSYSDPVLQKGEGSSRFHAKWIESPSNASSERVQAEHHSRNERSANLSLESSFMYAADDEGGDEGDGDDEAEPPSLSEVRSIEEVGNDSIPDETVVVEEENGGRSEDATGAGDAMPDEEETKSKMDDQE